MRISGIAGTSTGPVARRATAGQQEPEVAQSRALIAIEAAAPSERSFARSRHPTAPFLAQLIATRLQAPQTCARRRVGPQEAISVYAAMAARKRA
jgi:hypothetical protein